MRNFLVMTNAVKALIIVVINAVLGLLTSFGVNLSDKQQAAIIALVNAILGLWVALTYTYSHKRIDT
jgi:hypothetical protein